MIKNVQLHDNENFRNIKIVVSLRKIIFSYFIIFDVLIFYILQEIYTQYTIKQAEYNTLSHNSSRKKF